MKKLTLAVACFAVGASTAHAEKMALNEALGKTVVVWSPEPMEGRLTWIDTDTVALRLSTGESRDVERASITRMRVLAVHGARSYVETGLWGAVSGAALGLSTAAISRPFCRAYPTDCEDGPLPYRDGALAGAVYGVARALIPAWLHRWRDVEVGPSVQAGVLPVRRGAAVMATISF
jgi:hypothetical protein